MSRATVLLAALLCLLALAGPARGDLDVSTPPGTPDDWDRGLPVPVLTPTGSVPGPVITPGPDAAVDPDTTNPVDPRRTVTQDPPAEPINVPPPGLYGYFNILTPDMPMHLIRTFPELTSGGAGGGPVITGPRSSFMFPYPVMFPTELVWDAMCVCVRMQLHPEIVSEPAALAHLLVLGEPAVPGVQLAGRERIIEQIRDWIGPVPDRPPPTPSGRDLAAMLERLAVAELCNGYTGMLDPTYCQRTLSLGEDVVPALISCTRSGHSLLRRNATALLGRYRTREALERLRSLGDNPDLVVRIRAIKALARMRDGDAIGLFRRLTQDRDGMMRGLGWYGLGMLGDHSAGRELRQQLRDAVSRDNHTALFALLPATVRIAPADDSMRDLLTTARRRWRHRIPPDNTRQNPSLAPDNRLGTPVYPEPVGFRNRIYHELALLALVAMGDEEALDEFQDVRIADLHSVSWLLYCDAVAKLADRGSARLRLEETVTTPPHPSVALYALRLLTDMPFDPAWMRDRAMVAGDYSVRATALHAIAEHYSDEASELCRQALGSHLLGDGDDQQQLQLEIRALESEMNDMWRDPATPQDERQRRRREMGERLQELQSRLAGGRAPTGPRSRDAEAWFIYTAVRVGSKLDALGFADLAPAMRYCRLHGLTARRIAPDNLREIPDVSTFPPLLETIVHELGRLKDPRVVPLLLDMLAARETAGSPEAALALANHPGAAVSAALVNALHAEDGWLRFCAYRALVEISGEEFFCDWIFGDRRARESAIRRYASWYEDTRGD